MRLKVLGCSGAEFPGYNAPGFLLDSEIVFDAGSITCVLDEKAQSKIKHIFITHAHLDHVMSIPFLADSIIIGSNNTHKISIYSIPAVIRTIKKHLFNSSMWPDFSIIPNSHDAVLNFVELKAGEAININGYTITPCKVNHTVPAVGYLVEDKKNRRFFYTGDTGPTDRTWKRINKKIHSLIIDVSFPNSMIDMALKTGHLTPKLLEEELLKIHPTPERIYITHPKPQHFTTIQKELDELGMTNIWTLTREDLIPV